MLLKSTRIIKYLVNLQGNLKVAKYGVHHIFSDAVSKTVL